MVRVRRDEYPLGQLVAWAEDAPRQNAKKTNAPKTHAVSGGLLTEMWAWEWKAMLVSYKGTDTQTSVFFVTIVRQKQAYFTAYFDVIRTPL